WDHNYAVPIGHDHVSGTDHDTAARNWLVYRLHFVTPGPDAASRPLVVEWHLLLDNFIGVARTAAGYYSDSAPKFPAEDVVRSDRACIAIFVGVNDHYRPLAQVLREGLRRNPLVPSHLPI